MRVLICGGGAIGCTTAYFLARRGLKPIVIESTGIANAASGKAGGFLARDWCDGTPLEALARHSFALHAKLAAEVEGDWGYRRVATYGGHAGFGGDTGGRDDSDALEWLAPTVAISQQLGLPETTAQVHPRLFTNAMMAAAERLGGERRQARVAGIATTGRRVTAVETDSGTIEGDAVVIAMGPWSILAAQWLALPAVFGLKGHSLVFTTGDRIPPTAAFVEHRDANGAVETPELFPRPDGTTYVCAISSQAPLPFDPADVAADPGALARLERICADLSPILASAEIVARQACYRPVTRDGLPLIGRIAGVENAYIATGHSVWGILNAPATGEAMAELIADGASQCVDLAPFDPARLPPLDPKRLRLN